MSEAVNYAGWVEKGLLPIAGGLLDQSAWFIEVCNRLISDTNRLEAERMKSHG